MRTNPEYLARNAATTAGGIGVPDNRRIKPRHVLTSRLFCVHGSTYGRAVWGGETLAGSYCRYANLHGLPTLIGVGVCGNSNRNRSHSMTQAQAARSRKKSKPTQDTDLAELGKITFDSVLTDQQVEEFEAAQTEWGPKRRCALITLARTRQQLVDGFGSGDGPDVLLEMIGHVSDYEKHCKALAELAATAVARLMAVAAATIEKGATA